jgi:hypothetical protein
VAAWPDEADEGGWNLGSHSCTLCTFLNKAKQT